MRAYPNLQPDSRILWWLGGCKQVWWDSGAGLEDNDQFGGYDSKSTSQNPVPICPGLSWLSSASQAVCPEEGVMDEPTSLVFSLLVHVS